MQHPGAAFAALFFRASRYNPGILGKSERRMRYLALAIKVILFIFLLGFAVKNSDEVTLHYFLGYQWQTPLALVILVAFAIGLLVGLLACTWRLLRSHRELRQLRRLTAAHLSNESKPE